MSDREYLKTENECEHCTAFDVRFVATRWGGYMETRCPYCGHVFSDRELQWMRAWQAVQSNNPFSRRLISLP